MSNAEKKKLESALGKLAESAFTLHQAAHETEQASIAIRKQIENLRWELGVNQPGERRLGQ